MPNSLAYPPASLRAVEGLAVRLYSLLRRNRPPQHETLVAEANPMSQLSPAPPTLSLSGLFFLPLIRCLITFLSLENGVGARPTMFEGERRIRPLSHVRQCDRGRTRCETRRGGLVPLSRFGDMVVLLVAQVLVEHSRIVVVNSLAGAIMPSSSLQIIARPTFRINFRRRGRGTTVKEVIIIVVVLRLFLQQQRPVRTFGFRRL